MADPYYILVTTYMPVKVKVKIGAETIEETRVNSMATYYGKKDKVINVKGAVDYEVFNLGTKSVFMFESAKVLPGQNWSPTKSNPYPFNNDVRIKWEDTYELTKNPVVADVGSPR